MTSFSACSKSTLPPPFAATFGDRRPDLLSWRDLYTDAILFQSGREAGNLARSAKLWPSNHPVFRRLSKFRGKPLFY